MIAHMERHTRINSLQLQRVPSYPTRVGEQRTLVAYKPMVNERDNEVKGHIQD